MGMMRSDLGSNQDYFVLGDLPINVPFPASHPGKMEAILAHAQMQNGGSSSGPRKEQHATTRSKDRGDDSDVEAVSPPNPVMKVQGEMRALRGRLVAQKNTLRASPFAPAWNTFDVEAGAAHMSTTRSSRTVKPSSPETSPTRPRKPRGSHHHTSASRTSFSGKNPRLTLPKEDLINYEAMVSSRRDLQPRRQSPRKRDDGSLDEGSRLSDVQLVLDCRPVDNENFQHLRDANLYGHPRQNLPHAGPSHAYVHDFHPSHRYPRQRSSSPRSVDPDIPIIPSSQLFRPEPQRSFTSRPPRQQDSSDDVRDVFAVEDSDDQVPFGQPASNRRSSMNQNGSVPRKGGFVAHAKKPSIDQRSTKERPRSPMRSRASPTKDSSSPMKPAMMFRAEELEEVEETVEDPEGPFTDDLKDAGIEYTGRNAVQDSSGGQARREGNGGKASSSKQSIAGPSASRQEPTGVHLPRRPMRDRHGLPDHRSMEKPKAKAGFPSNGMIPSSSISQQHPHEHPQIAAVEIAWINDSLPLRLACVRMTNDELLLTGTIGDPPKFCRLNIKQCVTGGQTCSDTEQPLLMLDMDLGKSTLSHSRHGLAQLTNMDIDPYQFTQPQLIIAFKDQSQEGRSLVKCMEALLERLGRSPHRIPAQSATAIKTGYPGSHGNGRSTERPRAARDQRTSQAGDERRNIVVARKSRRESKAILDRATGRQEPSAKGKGKSRAMEDPSQTKLEFTTSEPLQQATGDRRGPRRHLRSTGYPPKYGEGSDQEENAPPRTSEAPPSNRDELLFGWPPQGRADLDITQAERYRVIANDFLNDTLIEFGLRYIISGVDAHVRSKVHLFNSFFYNKLSSRKQRGSKEDPRWPAYDSVKKWTKGRDIFDMDFVVIPINESLHWFLAVIYNPAGILRQYSPPPELPPMRKAKTRSSAAADAAGSDVDMDAHSAQEQRGQSPAYDLDLLQPEPPHSPAKARHHLASSGMNGEGAADASYASADPLDVMDEEILFTGDHHDVSRMSDGVLRMSIDLERNGLDPSPGRPIPSATWSIVNNQIEHASEDEDRVPSASPPKREVRPDAKIWQSNDCWILTFDSLGGAHRAVLNCLTRWLQYEARDKKGIVYDMPNAQYMEARVPQQPNFSDCGLYLIHYAKQLLENQAEILEFIQRRAPLTSSPDRQAYDDTLRQVWKADQTHNLRNDWVLIIDTLTQEYWSINEAKAAGVPREADRREADAQPPEEASQDSVAILESQQFHHIAAAESKSNADAGPSRPFLDPAISTVSNRSEESPRSVSRSSEDLDRAISTESPDPLDEAHTRGWGYGEAMDVARGAEQRSSDGRTARRHSASLSPPQPYDLAFDNAVFNDGNGAHMLSPERDDIFETDFAQPVSAARSRSTLAIGRQTGVPHTSNLSHPHQPGYREPVNESFENGSPVGSPNVDQSPLEGLGRPMADAQPNRGTVSTTSTMQSFEFPNPQLAIAPQMRDYTGTPAVRSSFQRHSPPPGVPFPASTGHYKTAATSVTHGETTLSSGGSESPVLSSAAMPSEREVETNEDEPQEELEDDANPAPAYSTRTSTSLQLAQPRRPSRTDPPDVGSATTLTGVAPSNARLSPIITYSKKGRSSGTGQAAKRPFDTPAGRATKKAKGMAPVVPGTGNTADAPIDIGSDED